MRPVVGDVWIDYEGCPVFLFRNDQEDGFSALAKDTDGLYIEVYEENQLDKFVGKIDMSIFSEYKL